jgi:dipeptidyl aminopeptidase/acylaminoacyl peptidase
VGFEWAPIGKAIILMELVFEESATYTVIRRVPMGDRPSAGKELVRMQGRIDFFNSPTTRYEYGAGSSDKPFSVVFGAADGLYTVPGNGQLPPHRLAEVPAEGLENIEWNPTGEQFAVYFKRQTSNKGKELQGLYLADVNRHQQEVLVPLYEFLDVHTLWFSAKGNYVVWATYPMAGRPSAMDSAIHVVSTKDPEDRIVIKQEDGSDSPLPITGVYMNKEETQLAYTALNRVFVYDLASGKRAQVAHFPLNDPQMVRFAAEPHWLDDRLVVAVYEDVSKQMAKERNTLHIDLPFKHKKELENLQRKSGGLKQDKPK